MADKEFGIEIKSSSINDWKILENEIRSNLRYVWQKSIEFAITCMPTLAEIKLQLEESFLAFIPKTHPNRDQFKRAISSSFDKVFNKTKKNYSINDEFLEEVFVEFCANKILLILKQNF
ncbi:MAG: hypothetical protein FK734_10165 [Asgard group archaeon]|nr:hypothetical protein [Asgard group archaeon]